ncbi:MAG: helix-turn-helix domain-containing protein [Erysipelotrichaceae bacterium]|nr:helix-turn-helix domain-containing protein [Erysipelotrichaceae bacterium]
MSFSTYFKELRKDRKLSQDELAKLLKVSNSQIRNIETGRTKLPRHELFDSLVKYVGGDPIDIAYDIFFKNEETEYDHKLKEIHKIYLASRWRYYDVINVAPRFIYKKDKLLVFDGLYWKSGFPYYKVLLGNYDRDKYLSAINDPDKDDKLRELIFKETLFLEDLANPEHIKEIRFILDKNNPDDCNIYYELEKINLINLGKEFEVCYLLYDTDARIIDSRSSKYYVTNKKTIINI